MYAWVYIVTNAANGTLYIGVTTNLERRIWEHRNGAIPGFTKRYGLKLLVYFEGHDDINTAIRRKDNQDVATRVESTFDRQG